MGGGIEATAELAGGALTSHALSAPVSHGEDHGPCPNCETELAGAFCHGCGQPAHLHRSFAAIGHEIAHGVFHFEGRTWATLPLLAWRPGDLTWRYVHGQRARFNSPLALFLFCVFLMFAVFHAVHPFGGGSLGKTIAQAAHNQEAIGEEQARANAALEVLQTARQKVVKAGGDPAAIDRQLEDAGKRKLTLDMAGKAAEATVRIGSGDRLTTRTGVPWIDRLLSRVSENPDLLVYKLQSDAYKFSWLLIPISLPFIWVVFFWRRDTTLYDHAIFAIHSLSFMTLLAVTLVLLAAAGVSGGWIALAVWLVPPVHIYRHLKGAYRLGRFGAGWRTLWLLFSGSIALLVFFAVLLSMGVSD